MFQFPRGQAYTLPLLSRSARNLTAPGVAYQTYAGIWINTNKKDKQRTKKIKVVGGSVSYQFETLFLCPIAPTVIYVKCYDYAVTRGNFSLGDVGVNLKAFTKVFQNPGTVMDVWLPLELSKTKSPSPSGKAEIRIQCAYAPTPPNLRIGQFISGTSLPPLRILLEKSTYVSGEVMRGVVIFNVRILSSHLIAFLTPFFPKQNCKQRPIKAVTLNIEVKEYTTIRGFQIFYYCTFSHTSSHVLS